LKIFAPAARSASSARAGAIARNAVKAAMKMLNLMKSNYDDYLSAGGLGIRGRKSRAHGKEKALHFPGKTPFAQMTVLSRGCGCTPVFSVP